MNQFRIHLLLKKIASSGNLEGEIHEYIGILWLGKSEIGNEVKKLFPDYYSSVKLQNNLEMISINIPKQFKGEIPQGILYHNNSHLILEEYPTPKLCNQNDIENYNNAIRLHNFPTCFKGEGLTICIIDTKFDYTTLKKMEVCYMLYEWNCDTCNLEDCDFDPGYTTFGEGQMVTNLIYTYLPKAKYLLINIPEVILYKKLNPPSIWHTLDISHLLQIIIWARDNKADIVNIPLCLEYKWNLNLNKSGDLINQTLKNLSFIYLSLEKVLHKELLNFPLIICKSAVNYPLTKYSSGRTKSILTSGALEYRISESNNIELCAASYSGKEDDMGKPDIYAIGSAIVYKNEKKYRAEGTSFATALTSVTCGILIEAIRKINPNYTINSAQLKRIY